MKKVYVRATRLAHVEQGNHTELPGLNGLNATFWARQSGGVIGTEVRAD